MWWSARWRRVPNEEDQYEGSRVTARATDAQGSVGPSRSVLVITHSGRDRAVSVACSLAAELAAGGISVVMPEEDRPWVERAGLANVVSHVSGPDELSDSCDLAIVVGGDGTILRAAEWVYGTDIPLLGLNLGHVGFLAEVEPENVPQLVQAVQEHDYIVEERTTLRVQVIADGLPVWHTWALNEVSVEKRARERMLEVVLEVDRRPLSRWGCDGVVVATPTGSTAYAWSAGGPVVWPQVEALIVVPLSAHALFARPLVVAPNSHIGVEVLPQTPPAVVWCDGRRTQDLPAGGRIEVTSAETPLRFARVHHRPFTDRLVRKFDLPVAGWRGRGPQ